jgi:hypothetical protein
MDCRSADSVRFGCLCRPRRRCSHSGKRFPAGGTRSQHRVWYDEALDAAGIEKGVPLQVGLRSLSDGAHHLLAAGRLRCPFFGVALHFRQLHAANCCAVLRRLNLLGVMEETLPLP